jgi:hypothetical protein
MLNSALNMCTGFVPLPKRHAIKVYRGGNEVRSGQFHATVVLLHMQVHVSLGPTAVLVVMLNFECPSRNLNPGRISSS